ncbi:hypothetical protein Hypma_006736 [Hypsizygus marmoreus]|uniref:Arrestin-like N-terminal domain-containing protein n=1 Tax=Hypsizygus marmoreus TaxID=39966 RepID=A0A369JTI0_HYPMA|nr:hypothetical protein Hypma_006736 [Hypsizygus marmoreus]
MADSELPEYVARQTGSEHSYSLESKGQKWITLLVHSRASNRSTALPAFEEGDKISGRVELNLEKIETIKAITITVEAGTIAVGQEEFTFLGIKKSLWSPTMSDRKTSGKLEGRRSWPFEFALPNQVPVSLGKGKEENMYRLPPNFSERASPAYIDYRLVVTVKRGAFRVNQRLATNFAYLPKIVPDPPSELRQQAYREAFPMLGPDGDPQGWKVLPSMIIKGILFEAQEVEVECTLAIAKPLCYAVGSPIPLNLTLKSESTQALDILAVPAAIRVHLVRSIATGSDATDETETRRSDNFFKSGSGQACFWPLGRQEDGERVLEGELEVPSTLKPSFTFPRFTVRYHLEMLPLEATGFRASAPWGAAALLSEKVIIATKQAPGIRPWSRIPPGYEKPQQADYNNAVGYLENGNQRFLHHGH